MDSSSINMAGSLLLPTLYFVLFSASDAKRCGYGLNSQDYVGLEHEFKQREPRRIGVKDCTWGCCFENSHDVCCAFPLEIALVVLISTLCLIIIIAVIVGLIKYLLSRRRRSCVHVNGSVCRHEILGNFGTLVYPGSSAILHRSYIHMDSELRPPLASTLHSSDSNLAVPPTHRKLSQQGETTSLLMMPVVPEAMSVGDDAVTCSGKL